MNKGVVKKAFPFAYDGLNVTHHAAGADFPVEGMKVTDGAFNGLVDTGYVEAREGREADEADVNRGIIAAIDLRLSKATDRELLELIARSGTPYSGNLIHADLVYLAKRQILAEQQGKEPVSGVDAYAGVVEQPLSKPGQATPPSAAAAVDAQNLAKEAALKNDAKLAKTAGENKMTDQFGRPIDGGMGDQGDQSIPLEEMTVAQLKEEAAKRDPPVDLTGKTAKADILAALQA